MKDDVGAEFAMRESEKKWRSQVPQRKPPTANAPRRIPTQSPAAHKAHSMQPPIHPVLHPSPAPMSAPHRHYSNSASNKYAPYMMGYSPMGVVHPLTPGYSHVMPIPYESQNYPRPHHPTGPVPIAPMTDAAAAATVSTVPKSERRETKRVVPEITPAAPTERKKRKTDYVEIMMPFFGPDLFEHSRSTAERVFSYLSKEELNQVSLVSKMWKNTLRDVEQLSKLS